MKKLLFAIAVSLVAVSSASAATSGLPGLTSQSTGKPQVKPKEIIYSGDGSALFAGTSKISHHISWSSWTATGASGSGAQWLNNCKPSCAGGKFSSYPVKLQASRPEVIAGHDVFTRLKVTYTGKRPKGAPKTKTGKLSHENTSVGEAFFWNGFPR
jgi:hypothetical protein